MADQYDVEQAIAVYIAGVLYPAGSPTHNQATAACGVPVTVARGWPDAEVLDSAVVNGGRALVTVFPGILRDDTRYIRQYVDMGPTATPLTATVSAAYTGTTVTLGGTPSAGQVLGLAVGPALAAADYSYKVLATDTLTTIAAALAALCGGTSSGASLVVPPSGTVTAISLSNVTSLLPLKQQRQQFRISCWAPSPTIRDQLASAIDVAMATVRTFALPDGSYTGPPVQSPGHTSDDGSKDGCYRRDVVFLLDYSTNQSSVLPVMLFGNTTVRPGGTLPPVVSTATVLPPPAIGAIRWDAWNSADAVNTANVAALAPSQFQYRLPFFATPTGGGNFSAIGTQANMDTEIQLAATAGLTYWAFLSWPVGAPQRAALNQYLTSAYQSQLNFCMIEQVTNAWFFGPSAELADVLAKLSIKGYQTVLDGRPLLYILDSSDADIAFRYGGHMGLQLAVQYIRQTSQAQGTKNPYIVFMSGDPVRAAVLTKTCGFDAASAYAVPGTLTAPTPYASLVTATEAWWALAASQGVPIVPPAMSGWNPVPRGLTPDVSFGSEAAWPSNQYYVDPSPSQLALHINDAAVWTTANPTLAPARTIIVYAWNENSEGGWLMPTYVSSNAAGNNSRLQALKTTAAVGPFLNVAIDSHGNLLTTPSGGVINVP